LDIVSLIALHSLVIAVDNALVLIVRLSESHLANDRFRLVAVILGCVAWLKICDNLTDLNADTHSLGIESQGIRGGHYFEMIAPWPKSTNEG
jgi:hypothetical protein